jgi:hypothetical protein
MRTKDFGHAGEQKMITRVTESAEHVDHRDVVLCHQCGKQIKRRERHPENRTRSRDNQRPETTLLKRKYPSICSGQHREKQSRWRMGRDNKGIADRGTGE